MRLPFCELTVRLIQHQAHIILYFVSIHIEYYFTYTS